MDMNLFYRRIFQFKEIMTNDVTQSIVENSSGLEKTKAEELIKGVELSLTASFDKLINSLMNVEKNYKNTVIESTKPAKTTKTARKRK